MRVIHQKLGNTLKSMSFVSVFCSRDGSSVNASVPSVASGFSGEASESERVCTSVTGLTGNTESVSECGLRLDGEQALDDSVDFRFSAGNQTKKKQKKVKQSDEVQTTIKDETGSPVRRTQCDIL